MISFQKEIMIRGWLSELLVRTYLQTAADRFVTNLKPTEEKLKPELLSELLTSGLQSSQPAKTGLKFTA